MVSHLAGLLDEDTDQDNTNMEDTPDDDLALLLQANMQPMDTEPGTNDIYPDFQKLPVKLIAQLVSLWTCPPIVPP